MGKNPIQAASNISDAYVTWSNDDERATAFAAFSKAIDSMEVPHRAVADAGNRMYQGIDTNTSVRSGFNRTDYEFFRPMEATPRRTKDIIAACMWAYQSIGLIRNIIDLMGDFTSRGIRLVHSNPATEDFYRQWFIKVNGPERSERFLNMLYRAGNVIVKRNTARIKSSMVEQLRRGMASPDVKMDDPVDPDPGEIPWRYFFLNPLTLDVISNDLAVYANQFYFGLSLPPIVTSTVRKVNKNKFEQSMVNGLPKDIVNAINQEKRVINLDPKKIGAYYYKKDDWDAWAYPMINCILKDLILLEKMKLADLAALDGAISRVRLWNLGDLENKILPTDAAISKLSNILMNTSGNGGVIDLIWGPELSFSETSTDVHQFLGSDKYEPILRSIYSSLGIPPSLIGMGGEGGSSQSMITIRAFMERLKYGRQILNNFWLHEVNIVRKAMMKFKNGFQDPPQIMYEHTDLTDEYAQRKLLVDLADRDIISIESVQEEFGRIPEVEEYRLKREMAARKAQPKVSPYHDAQPDLSLEKIALQRGIVTPSEVGLELKEKAPDQMSALDVQLKGIDKQNQAPAAPESKPKGKSGQGRPKNSKDKAPRERRRVVAMLWARKAQSTINDVLVPVFTKHFAKGNVRKFTDDEHNLFENFKFGVLCNMEPFSNVTPESIMAAADKSFGHHETQNIFDYMVDAHITETGRKPSIEERREMMLVAYTGSLEDAGI